MSAYALVFGTVKDIGTIVYRTTKKFVGRHFIYKPFQNVTNIWKYTVDFLIIIKHLATIGKYV